MDIQLGIFNRPWNFLDLEQALKSMSNSGYKNMGFLRHKQDFLIDFSSTESEVEKLKQLIQKYNLNPVVYYPTLDLEIEVAESISRLQTNIDLIQKLGADYLLTMGSMDKNKKEKYCKIISEVTDYAREREVLLTVKPHGGISRTAVECRELIEEIDSDNFRIFYDPYNVIEYSEDISYSYLKKDLKAIIDYTQGFIVKNPLTSPINYKVLFEILKANNFSGPCMVELVEGEAKEEIDLQAQKSYKYLKSLISE